MFKLLAHSLHYKYFFIHFIAYFMNLVTFCWGPIFIFLAFYYTHTLPFLFSHLNPQFSALNLTLFFHTLIFICPSCKYLDRINTCYHHGYFIDQVNLSYLNARSFAVDYALERRQWKSVSSTCYRWLYIAVFKTRHTCHEDVRTTAGELTTWWEMRARARPITHNLRLK